LAERAAAGVDAKYFQAALAAKVGLKRVRRKTEALSSTPPEGLICDGT